MRREEEKKRSQQTAIALLLFRLNKNCDRIGLLRKEGESDRGTDISCYTNSKGVEIRSISRDSNPTPPNIMRIIQTKGIVENGQINLTIPPELKDGEVDIIIVAEHEPDEFEVLRQIALTNGYNSKEKIMELIHKVKLDMLEEKGRTKSECHSH